MKLIAARREKMDRDIAAAAAEAAAEKARSDTPSSPSSTASIRPDPQYTTPYLHHSTSRPQLQPSAPPPQGSPTGHNPKPWYDVPTPRRELSTMNKACS